MSNPNGFGTVVKLSGNRRNPFAVRKTTGFNEKGHPIFLVIGYTATREDGLILLANYNKSPWDVDSEKMTLAELFEFWKEKKMPKLGKASQNSLKAAFNRTKKFHATPYKKSNQSTCKLVWMVVVTDDPHKQPSKTYSTI